jgi:hypothetical protein
MLPSPQNYAVGTLDYEISELNGWPACTPVKRFTDALADVGA